MWRERDRCEKDKRGENCCLLLEENLGGAFAEHPEASVSILEHGAHGFSDRVEGVDFVEGLLGDLVPYCLVVLF